MAAKWYNSLNTNSKAWPITYSLFIDSWTTFLVYYVVSLSPARDGAKRALSLYLNFWRFFVIWPNCAPQLRAAQSKIHQSDCAGTVKSVSVFSQCTLVTCAVVVNSVLGWKKVMSKKEIRWTLHTSGIYNQNNFHHWLSTLYIR